MLKHLFIILTLVYGTVFADTNATIRHLSKTFSVDTTVISPTPFAGVFEIITKDPIRSVLVSADGKYLIQGDVLDLISRQKMPSSNKIKEIKLQLLNSIKDEDKIIFKAKNEKYILHVFTDVDCPFCKKLHAGMRQMNNLGISVKYLASPLASLHPKAQSKMEKIWCSNDRVKAMHDYKTKNIIPDAKACKNPVAEQLLIAQQLGVNGTPAIFIEDGTVISGYAPPKKLLKSIQAALAR